MKENDLILNMLANPTFTLTDLQTVGLNSDNTGLQSEDKYIESDKIKSNPAFQTNGQFDKNKFHNFYESAGLVYNQLATNNYDEEVLKQARYSKDNIFVNPSQRTLDYSPKLVKKANPYLTNNSLDQLGQIGPRSLSISEIAQTQQVVDPVTGKKSASPNDSFFSNLFNTLVLAQYDSDEKDKDGNIIHAKGDLKYNEDGLPYYEYLAGRSVHNKQVLNKMDVLTTDGSNWNKFDFFDSDDLNQKGLGATLLKNSVLVGSMFIPYVGPVITGLSVATQTAGLFANLGKLIVGSDNKTLNNIEGWSKTVNRQNSTEYAQNHTWCTENFLNMIGDTIGQLAEQRWIFKAAPVLFEGKDAYKAMSNSGYEALRAKKLEELNVATQKTTEQLLKESIGTKSASYYQDFAKALYEENANKATKYVDDIVKAANKIGSPISKAYMTGITVQDTYGQAKEAGATDMEAALLTIGYAAGEAWILNTGLGEWILPELHIDKFKNRAIADGLLGITSEARATLNATGDKVGFVNKLLRAGKQLASQAQAQRTLAGKTISTIGAHALGEGFEETSEEVLADLSKSIFNVTRWLRGEDSLNFWQGDNILDRYVMSALGGLVGGGLTSAATNFRQIKSLSNMNNSQAMQQLIYMANNNQLGDFLHSIDKMTLGDKNKSATKIIKTDNSGYVFAQGTEDDNQDLMAKQSIRNVVNFINNTLQASGAKLSTESLISKLTLEDQTSLIRSLKIGNLRNASVLGEYVQEFQNLQAQLIQQNQKLQEVKDKMGDVKSKTDPQLIQEAQNIETQIQEITKQLHSYLNGEISPYVIRDTIFQLNPLFNDIFIPASFEQYVKTYKGKDIKDLSDSEQKSYWEEYKDYNNGVGKDQTKKSSELFFNMMKEATPAIQQQLEQIKASTTDQKIVNALNHWAHNYLMALNLPSENVESYINQAQKLESGEGMLILNQLLQPFYSNDIKKRLSEIENKPEFAQEKAAIINTTIISNVDKLFNPIIKQGFINPEIKQAVPKILKDIQKAYEYFYNSRIEEAYEKGNREVIKILNSEYAKFNDKVNNISKQLEKLPSTPIMSLLDSFILGVTKSPFKISEHYNNTISRLNDNAQDLSDFGLDESWEVNNEQAIKLAQAFRAVVEGMKVDNADISNPTGYSKILNELFQKYKVEGFNPLAEIDTNQANLILQDINQVLGRLTYAQRLAALNRGQKLKEQNRVAVNKNFLIYDSTKRLIDAISDSDWKDKDKLKAVFDNIPTEVSEAIQSRNVKIPKPIRQALEKYIITLDNAIYDFFNANKDSNGQLNVNKLARLLKDFAGVKGFFQKTEGILNAETKFLDDNSYIWYIASRAAVKATNFYSSYLKSINDKVAPIATQELSSYLGVAAITNMPMLNTFVKAYRQSVISEFNKLPEDKKKEYLNNFDGSGDSEFARKLFGGHDVLPQYLNMILIEGIAGSGKSKAVFSNIINIIRTINPDYINNSFYIHETSKSAKDTSTELGLTGKTFSRVEFLKFISNDWKDVRNNKHKNKEGREYNYLYDDSYGLNSENQLINRWAINKETNLPKVVFIDEISHYNQQEISMIEQWAKENGIVVLTAGDFDQDTLTSFISNKNISTQDIGVTLNRNNFIRSPKLGVSLRTLNKQLTNSTKAAQLAIQTLRSGGNIDNLDFNYLENDSSHKGLYGVKTVSIAGNVVTDNDLSSNKVEDTIKSMIETLEDGQKIGYIYHDENSALYKLLTTKYADKIEKFKDSDAQGLEGQYYIVDTNLNESDDLTYLRSLYTGITRASQGVLVLTHSSVGHIQLISSKEDNNFQLESLGEEAIKNASKDKKELLEEMFKDTDGITNITSPQTISLNNQQSITHPSTGLPVIPPSPTPSPAPPTSITTKKEVQNIVDQFVKDWKGFVAEKDGNKFKIKDVTIAENSGNYTPYVKLDDGTEVSLEEFKNTYNKVKEDDETPAPIYSVGESFIYNNGNKDIWVTIKSIDTSDGIKYTLENSEEDIVITEEQLKNGYKGKTPSLPLPTIQFTDNIMENTPEEQYKQEITESNIEEEPISENPFGVLYSFNTYNPSVINDNGIAKFDDESSEGLQRFNARIDGFIGLMHILQAQGKNSSNYKYLDQLFSTIRVSLFTQKNNGELVNRIKELLNLKNASIQYALKSSAGRTTYSDYYRYDQGDSEQLSYLHSDDDSAREVPRKTIVALIMENGKPVSEIPVCTLNSPLTILNMVDEKGESKFKNIKQEFAKYQNQDAAILGVIKTFDGKCTIDEQKLIDLFKIFRFTSNGIFFLDKDFNLASNSSSGIHLTGAKGINQLNGRFITENKFISISELLSNPQFSGSKILMSKDGSVEGKTVIRAGHPFILVGDSRYDSQDKLIARFKQQVLNDSLDKDIKLYYVLPPRTSIKNWLLNQHNLGLNSLGETHTVYNIGNDLTGYRILQCLRSNLDSIPSIGSAKNISLDDSGVKRAVITILTTAQNIEDKWNVDNPNLDNSNTIEGIGEQDYYNNLISMYKNDNTRVCQILKTKELLQYLNSRSNNPYLGQEGRTNNQTINAYLACMVWNRTFDPLSNKVTTTYRPEIEQLITQICKSNGLDGVYYKVQYSGNNVDSFTEIAQADNYQLYGVNNELSDFQINARIDTPTFFYDAFPLNKIANSFYWDSSRMVYRVRDKHDENIYLGKIRQNEAKTEDDEFKDYINKGLLTNDDVVVIKQYMQRPDVIQAVKQLGITDPIIIKECLKNISIMMIYNNKNKHNWAFLAGTKLILTNNQDYIITERPKIITTDNIYVDAIDKAGNQVKLVFYPKQDTNGNFSELNYQVVNFTPIQQPSQTSSSITESQLTDMHNATSSIINDTIAKTNLIYRIIHENSIDKLNELLTKDERTRSSLIRVTNKLIDARIKALKKANKSEDVEAWTKVKQFVDKIKDVVLNNVNTLGIIKNGDIIWQNNIRLAITDAENMKAIDENGNIIDVDKDKALKEDAKCAILKWI